MDMCKLMAGAVMISPYLPMLFMGEEWAEPNPFLFFISHTDKELAALVNKGRKEEFSYLTGRANHLIPGSNKHLPIVCCSGVT